MAQITTTQGLMDESELLKSEGAIDNETETTSWVEYCLAGCDDPVHKTGQPQQAHFHCPRHVHRSIAMHLKRGMFADSAVGDFS